MKEENLRKKVRAKAVLCVCLLVLCVCLGIFAALMQPSAADLGKLSSIAECSTIRPVLAVIIQTTKWTSTGAEFP